jgi:hypothetical protein
MKVECPNCEKKYSVEPNHLTQSAISVPCTACQTPFQIDLHAQHTIICPNCSFDQIKSKECKKCGIIFEKFIEKSKIPLHDRNWQDATQKPVETKLFNWKKVWLICSILYFILMVIDGIIVYPNEFSRPKRDKFNATIDLIDYSEFLAEMESIKRQLEDMIDRRMRKSLINDFFQVGCQSTGKFHAIKKSNSMILARFRDGTLLKCDHRNSTVVLIKKKIPNDAQFAFFPTLKGLHTRYENVDPDIYIRELQTLYDYLDYSVIEEEYQNSLKWLNVGFALFGFLLFIIPVLLGYFLALMLNWYQRWNYTYYKKAN